MTLPTHLNVSTSSGASAAQALVRELKATEKNEAFEHRGVNTGNPKADGGVYTADTRPADMTWYLPPKS